MLNYNLTNIDRVIDEGDRVDSSEVVGRIQDELWRHITQKVMEEVNKYYDEDITLKEVNRLEAKIMLDLFDYIDNYESEVE